MLLEAERAAVPWRYGLHRACARAGRACYFRNPTACPEGPEAPPFPAEALRHVDTAKVAGGLAPLEPWEHQGLFWWSAHMLGWVVEAPLPPSSRPNWTRLVPPSVLTGHVSSLLRWVVEAGGGLHAKRRNAEAAAGMRRPAVGLHIRRGDACVHAAQATPPSPPARPY